MIRVALLAGPGAPRLDIGASLLASREVETVPVQPASEAQLRKVLSAQSCPMAVLVLELFAVGAGYATATLADSQGQPRKVNAQVLGQALAQAGVRVVILASDSAPETLRGVAQALVDKGVGAVVALPRAGAAVVATVSALLQALARGDDVASTVGTFERLHAGGQKAVLFGDAGLRVAAPALDQRAVSAAPVAAAAVDDAAASDPAPALLRAKRNANRFDVFLCHNSADKPAVRTIGARLKQQGILPWLDEWELPPGQPWQALLEQQIGRIGSAAVFIGSSGISPWHQQEMRGFISEFVDRQLPVIPVLLSDAPAKPELPLFLRQMTWVDFRVGEPDPFERLVWGITGERPAQWRSL